MTREEELRERVERLASRFERFGERQAIEETLEALLQVEVEVWEKVIERIETMMELENESTDDQVWEFRDWCREQAKEVR